MCSTPEHACPMRVRAVAAISAGSPNASLHCRLMVAHLPHSVSHRCSCESRLLPVFEASRRMAGSHLSRRCCRRQGHDRYGGGPGRPGPDGMQRSDRMPGMGRGGANGMAGFPPMPMPGTCRTGVTVC